MRIGDGSLGGCSSCLESRRAARRASRKGMVKRDRMGFCLRPNPGRATVREIDWPIPQSTSLSQHNIELYFVVKAATRMEVRVMAMDKIGRASCWERVCQYE